MLEISGCPGVLTPKNVAGQPHFRPMVVHGHPSIYVFHEVLNWLHMTPKKIDEQLEIVITWLSIGHLSNLSHF